jgi:hypothetical protein
MKVDGAVGRSVGIYCLVENTSVNGAVMKVFVAVVRF